MPGFKFVGAPKNCDRASGMGALLRRNRLLSSYVLNLSRGARAVRAMIVEDILYLRELGAERQASDLDAVLACFVARYPEAAALPLGGGSGLTSAPR